MRRLTAALVALATALAVVGGCAPDPSDDPRVAGSATVAALDNTFRAEVLEVAAGATVTWRNVGRNDHDVRPSDGAQASQWGVGRAEFAPGDEYQHTFDQPGTFAYYCTIHGTSEAGMTGTIVVTEGDPDTTPAPPDGGSTVDTSAETADSTAPGDEAAAASTIRVPDDEPTIQAAVDAAQPGDLVLVGAGTYRESVDVTTDRLTIRGLDRNDVVLDGEFQRENGIRVLGADGVTLENMTATNYTVNAFFWTGVEGYRGSYLTAYRTGDYGVYAFDSIKGQLDHIYAAGSPDAGVYIGQCYPCDAVVDRVLSEHNGLGYSGTNAGGNLLIINSVFRNNRAGIVPNSGSYELCYPQRDTTFVGNVVHDNNQADTAAIDVALLAMGNGVVIAGGVGNTIERNLVFDHDKGGIALVPYLEEDPNDTLPPQEEWDRTCAEARDDIPEVPTTPLIWNPIDNSVEGNELADNRQADIILGAVDDVSTLGNCFAGNTHTSSVPAGIETLAPCGAPAAPAEGWTAAGTYDVAAWLTEQKPPNVDWRTAPLPPLIDHEQMPGAATAPGRPAVDVPPTVDLAAITVPARPSP